MFGGAVTGDNNPPMVRFVPQTGGGSYTDPSYHLPAFQEQWGSSVIGSSRSAYWSTVAKTSRAFFKAATHPVTSLSPNLATFQGPPERGSTFMEDAWRTARNVALDLAWYATDYTWQVDFCNRLHTFFRNLSTWPKYGMHFTLDGTQTTSEYSEGLMAMNAVCALASNQTTAWDFVDILWNTTTPSGLQRYYYGSLYLEAWLHLSGNFRAFWPRNDLPVDQVKPKTS